MKKSWRYAAMLGIGMVAIDPAMANNTPPFFHDDTREAPMRFYLIAGVEIVASSAAMAQFMPPPPPPVPGSISVTASSVNGVPRTVNNAKRGPGTFVSATASSTPGGTASASATAFASESVTRFDVP